MGQLDTSDAFARAMETADCETLIGQIGEWFDKPYRNPTNALDIAVCVQSAVHTSFAKKIDEARRNWRMNEADEWEASRRAFDNAMRAAVEAIGTSPEAEIMPRHDPIDDQRKWGGGSPQSKWGDVTKRPAIGAGWGQPAHH